MVDIKSKTIFSKIPLIPTKSSSDEIEDNKISEWLEKLHIQGEKVRIDNNRREEAQVKANSAENLAKERIVKEKVDNNAQSDIDAHTRVTAAKNQADIQMVNDLVRKSNRCIISISSSFPWSIFPNTIDIEESRVTFKFSQFLSSQSHSVELKDISNVFIESSVFFATLQVVSRTYVQNDIKIGHLNKKKAVLVQRVIEGLRTFSEHNINTSNYEIDELISKIGEFHNAHTSD
jgi:hypothetical protein